MELTPEEQKDILQRAVRGDSKTKICADLGIRRWDLWEYEQQHHAFHDSLARALSEGIEAQTDSLLHVYDEHKDPQRARGISDNVKWLASRRKAGRYGDRIGVDIDGKIDIAGTLIEARKRSSLPMCDQQAIEHAQDAEYEEISPSDTNGSEPQDDEGIDIFS